MYSNFNVRDNLIDKYNYENILVSWIAIEFLHKHNLILEDVLSLGEWSKGEFNYLNYKNYNFIFHKNKMLLGTSNKLKGDIKYHNLYKIKKSQWPKFIDIENEEFCKNDLQNAALIGFANNEFIFKSNLFFYYLTLSNEISCISYKEISILNLDLSQYEITLNNEISYPMDVSNIAKNKCWVFGLKYNQPIKELFSLVAHKIILDIRVLKNVQLIDIELLDLLELIKEDLINNGLYQYSDEFYKVCHISGWRFNYVFEGLCLKQLKTTENNEVYSISKEVDSLIVNQTMKTNVSYPKPKSILDLALGCKVKLLPLKLIKNMNILDHAQLRYAQRINQLDYTCEMEQYIYSDIYNNGIVIEGSHTEDRRKIYTESIEYIVDEESIISTWGKNRKPIKKRKKSLSRGQKQLERINMISKNIS